MKKFAYVTYKAHQVGVIELVEASTRNEADRIMHDKYTHYWSNEDCGGVECDTHWDFLVDGEKPHLVRAAAIVKLNELEEIINNY